MNTKLRLVKDIRRYLKRAIPSIKYLGIMHFLLGVIIRSLMFCRIRKIAQFFEHYYSNKITDYIISNYNELIAKKMPDKLSNIIPPIIWTLWWQGVENAPKSVRLTLNSIINKCSNCEVIIITSKNFANYANIPDHILHKFNSGIISIQNFSDILRCALITQKGGIWMDANLFVIEDIYPTVAPHEWFWTTKSPNLYKWTGFCMGGTRNNPLTKSVFDIFSAYWKDNDSLIDYFLIDRIIEACYRQSYIIQEMIDKVPINNIDIMWFLNNLSKTFSEKCYSQVIHNSKIFKLTHKINILDPKHKYITKLISEFSCRQ